MPYNEKTGLYTIRDRFTDKRQPEPIVFTQSSIDWTETQRKHQTLADGSPRFVDNETWDEEAFAEEQAARKSKPSAAPVPA